MTFRRILHDQLFKNNTANYSYYLEKFMKQLTTAFLLATGFTAASQAASPLEFYGKANLTLQQTDVEDIDTNPANGLIAKDVWEVKSNASRFGVKGEFVLSESLNAFYQFEWEVDVTDANDAGHFKARNQGVGLQGGFGRALVGRWDTPAKMLQT
jgi:predicted porin